MEIARLNVQILPVAATSPWYYKEYEKGDNARQSPTPTKMEFLSVSLTVTLRLASANAQKKCMRNILYMGARYRREHEIM